jgi:hypothetical protein
MRTVGRLGGWLALLGEVDGLVPVAVVGGDVAMVILGYFLVEEGRRDEGMIVPP